MTVRIPDNSKRTMFVGRTGSGKSHSAIELLSFQDWDSQPWVIIDYKGEDLVADILRQNKQYIRHIRLSDKPPKRPGLYYLKVNAVVDNQPMENWLLRVHKQGNIGLFIDEGYAMPGYGDSPGFTLILTQGRSLSIPVIVLYQRPVWMSRFAVAQADFIRVFKQGDIRDEKVTLNYCPPAILENGNKVDVTTLKGLPDFYSLWHDVGRGRTDLLTPSESKSQILNRYRTRLTPQNYRSLV